jgi:hypothetical protein
VHLWLLIAQVDHGPGEGMAIVHVAFVGILVLGGLVFVVLRAARKRSGGDAPRTSDRDPERDGRPDT